MENWKKIKDYPSYSVSDMGRVRNDNTGYIKVANYCNQYPQISLIKNKRLKSRFIHKLVAEAFLEKPDWAEVLTHIDGDKTNAILTNLKWATRSENCKHAHVIGNNKTAEKQGRPVRQFSIDGEFVADYLSIMDAHRKTGVDKDSIRLTACKKHSQGGGYKWEYIKDRQDLFVDDIEGEVWEQIPDYQNYSVSNFARVKVNKSGRLLKQQLGGGYYKVQLWKGKSYLTIPVHRLVALAFVCNPDKYNTINHINGIKTDNIPTNLEWCSFSENSLHAVRTGLNKSKEYSSKKVECLTLGGEHVAFYSSLAEAGRIVNSNAQLIGAVASGKSTRRSTAAGYKWRFVA